MASSSARIVQGFKRLRASPDNGVRKLSASFFFVPRISMHFTSSRCVSARAASH